MITLKTDDKGIKVFRKDRQTKAGGTFATYSISISSKDRNDAWVSAYVDVKFKKDVEVNNKAVIKINNAFPVVEEYNGNKSIKYMVTDFEVIEKGEKSVETDSEGFSTINMEDMDLPFAGPTRQEGEQRMTIKQLNMTIEEFKKICPFEEEEAHITISGDTISRARKVVEVRFMKPDGTRISMEKVVDSDYGKSDTKRNV